MGTEMRVEVCRLRQISHLLVHSFDVVTYRFTVNARGAANWLNKTQKGEQRGGLAGAVAAEQGKHLALLHVEVHTVEHSLATAVDGQAFCRQNWIAHESLIWGA